MRLHELHQSQVVAAPLKEVWHFFSQPANLRHLTPPGVSFEQVGGDPAPMYAGQMLWYRLRPLPFLSQLWVTEITHVVPEVMFVDEQRAGPCRLWHHVHRFRAVEGGTEIVDHVVYAMPFWPAGEVAHALYVRPMLEKVFAFRRESVASRFGG